MHRNVAQYELDPATRYPTLNLRAVTTHQVRLPGTHQTCRPGLPRHCPVGEPVRRKAPGLGWGIRQL